MKGVLFDFNGTLFWDTDYHNRAFDIFVERYLNGTPEGYRTHPLTADDKRFHIMGQTNNTVIPFVFSRSLTPEEIARFAAEKEQIYRDLCRDKVILAPGCRELFARLRDEHVPFTIASSSDGCNIDFYYEQTDLESWIPRRGIVYNDGTIRHGKPAPDIFLRAIDKLGVEAADVVIFEDSDSGIKAAEAAGAGQIIVVGEHPEAYTGPYPAIDDFRKAIPLLFG